MTIRRAWYITCSRCGGWPAQISCESAADARSIAASEGYVRIGREDVCPNCAGRPGGINVVTHRWEDDWPAAVPTPEGEKP